MNRKMIWLSTSLLLCTFGCGTNENKSASPAQTEIGTPQTAKPTPTTPYTGKTAPTSYPKVNNFNKLAGTMPQSAEMMFAFPGFEGFLNIIQTAWSNTSDAGLLLGDVISPLKDGNPNELGFNPTAPILVSIDNLQRSPQFLIRLDANDEQKAIKTIGQILTELKVRVDSETRNGIKITSVEGTMAFAAQGGAIWISMAERTATQALVKSLGMVKQNPLSKDQGFQRAAKQIGNDSSYIAYTSSSLLALAAQPLKNDPDLAMMGTLLSQTSGIIQAIKLDNNGMEMKIQAILAKDNLLSNFKKTNAQDVLLSQLPTTPLFVAKSNIDLQSVWDFVTKSGALGPDAAQADAALEKELGGFHKKIISTYEGPLTVSIHEPTKDDALPIVPVLYFKGKDGKVLTETLEFVCNKFEGSTKSGPDGSKWCTLDREPAMFGVWKDHFMVTTNSLDVGFVSELGKKTAQAAPGLTKALTKSSMLGMSLDFEGSINATAKNRQLLQELDGFPGAFALATLQYMTKGALPTSFSTHMDLNDNILEVTTTLEGPSNAVLAAPLIGAIGAAIAIPNFVSMQYKSKRGEVPMNIKAIKTAQIQYESAYDVFVNCDEYPPRSWGAKEARPWITSQSGGFETLNWAPDGNVRGSYSVTTTGGQGTPRDFTIIGVIDADGDGVYATYTATKSTNPISPTTSADVY